MHLNPAIAALLESLNHPSLPGIDLSLARMEELLAALDNPQHRLPPTVHIAGTNGKGSTLAFLAGILQAQGHRVDRYHSPHLVAFNERILLGGVPIADDVLLPLLERVAAACKTIPATFFEATTAAAFLAYAASGADYLLLETGMGGRLDATNRVAPVLTILSPIGLDHQEFLGEGIAAIAGEKVGILKAGVPCISAPQVAEALEVIQARALALAVPLEVVTQPSHLKLGLRGEHQRMNAAVATAAAKRLGVSAEAVATGLLNARWPARLQPITRGPLADAYGNFYLDGGHNAHAARVLAEWAAAQPQPVALLLGMMARKDARAFLAPLAPVVEAVCCLDLTGHDDARPAEELASDARAVGVAEVAVASDPETGMALLQRYQPATVLVAGSLYLAGDLLKNHE